MASDMYIGVDSGGKMGLAIIVGNKLTAYTVNTKAPTMLGTLDKIEIELVKITQEWSGSVSILMLSTQYGGKSVTQTLFTFIKTYAMTQLAIENLFTEGRKDWTPPVLHDDDARRLVFPDVKISGKDKKGQAHILLQQRFNLNGLQKVKQTKKTVNLYHADTMDATIAVLAHAKLDGVNIKQFEKR